MPDHRKPGSNTRYSIPDVALGAFGIFFTQSSSFLEYQRHLQRAKGQNNAATLFGVKQIPSNNQIRNLLDPIAPSHLDGVFLEVFDRLADAGLLRPFRVLDNQLLLAMDGTSTVLQAPFIVNIVCCVRVRKGKRATIAFPEMCSDMSKTAGGAATASGMNYQHRW